MKQFNSNVCSEVKDKLANRIAETILKHQLKISNKFYLQTSGWNKSQQLVFLLLTSLAIGGMSIVIMIDCLHASTSFNSAIPAQITSVKGLHREDKSLPITDKEFKAVQEYKLKHPELNTDRPELYDSLQLIEEMYQSQKK